MNSCSLEDSVVVDDKEYGVAADKGEATKEYGTAADQGEANYIDA